jgi:uncharacterized protein YdeI (YjbR/CyaY-like superfamily)
MNTFYSAERSEWREWLAENYKTAEEIWLINPRKESGLPRIPYHEAVEEALCFGWIDSINKRLEDGQTAQRYTPRRPTSSYSQTNKERLRRLVAQDKVLPEFLDKVNEVLAEPFHFPEDIKAALQANEQAWANFQNYSAPYQRIRATYVDWARKRPDEFEKRLNNLIKKSEQNKQFGFGIKDFY